MPVFLLRSRARLLLYNLTKKKMPSPECPICITACPKSSPKCNTCKQRACYTCVAKLVKSAPCGWPIMRWPCPTCRTEIHVLTTDVKSKQMLRALLPCAEARTNDLRDFVGMAFDRNGALTIVQRIVSRIRILLIRPLNHDFKLLVRWISCREMHAYVATENDAIICVGVLTIVA